jgi:hypothetical protein
MSQKITLVPDDGFYYLHLARHFASSGVWTFDGGVSRTTGFHLLHAYVCALFFWLFPGASPAQYLAFHGVLAAVLTTIAARLLLGALAPHFGWPALFACPAVVLSGGALSCMGMAMEWPYVVFFGALGFSALVRGGLSLAFVAGTAGVLARSDFAVFASCALAVSAWPSRWGPSVPRSTRMASMNLAMGALVGLAIVSIHTFAVSGYFAQGSTRIKEHWGKVIGYNMLPGLDAPAITTPLGYVMLRPLHCGPLSFLLIAGPALAFVTARALFPAKPKATPLITGDLAPRAASALARYAVLVSVADLLGYALAYGFNAGAAQPWYSANAVAPLVVLHAALLDALSYRALRRALGATALLVAVNIVAARAPNWRAQELTWKAANELVRAPPAGRLAAWNAGILATFSGREVVNIDGLMNDEVYPYVVTDTLHCYVLRKDIRFIVDSPVMFSPPMAMRGGYANGILEHSVVGRVLIADGASRQVLYTVDRPKLAAASLDCAPPESAMEQAANRKSR